MTCNKKELLELYNRENLHILGQLAYQVKEKIHGKNYYDPINRHINYTNVRILSCKFCGYYKKPKELGSYTLSIEEILEKLGEVNGLRKIHIVGGLNSELLYSYCLKLIRKIKALRPNLRIRAFTCVEIDFLSKISKKSVEEVLSELKEAGLDCLLGRGAEIFSERIRKELYSYKNLL